MEPAVSMSYDQARHNLLTIRSSPKAIYAVEKDGEIKAISKWNILGRLYHHIKGDSKADVVKQAIGDSLDSVERNINVKSCFYRPPKKSMFDMYIRNKPFSDVAESIRSVRLIKSDPALVGKTDTLESKCKRLFSQIEQVKELYSEVIGMPPEVNDNDKPEVLERLFNKYLPNAGAPKGAPGAITPKVQELFDVVGNDDANQITKLAKEGADVNATGIWGSFSVLMQAALSGKVEAVKALLDSGANVNQQDIRGMTALHNAAEKIDNVDVVKVLLDKGADPTIKCWGHVETALQIATKQGGSDIVKILLNYNVTDEDMGNALELAKKNDNKEIQELLQSALELRLK